MNVLPKDRQIQVISALTEGCSIRATERLTDTHRDTIMRLGLRVGEGCAALHNWLMRDLNVSLIELDEMWGFVGKKQKHVTSTDWLKMGDQYVFIALDAVGKAIITYAVGKRDGATTNAFLADLRDRVLNRPQITSDAFVPYIDAVERAFGADVDYGRLAKHYHAERAPDAARRYSPGDIVSVRKARVAGRPRWSRISTSHVERSNLTLRMQSRRFTRLTNGHSKKLRNHKAAVSLYVAHYNLCRVHEALRMTPAMVLGVADHIWTVGELIDAVCPN